MPLPPAIFLKLGSGESEHSRINAARASPHASEARNLVGRKEPSKEKAMFSSDLKRRSVVAFAAAGAMVLAATAAHAAMSPLPPAGYSTTDIQLSSGGCGAGFRRTFFGHRCVRDVPSRRHCQQGMHSESFPNGQGYRCVLNR